MNSKSKLQLCVISNVILLICIIIICYHFNTDSKYFRFGPSDDLIVISVKINTYSRYAILLILLTLLKIIKVIVEELGTPVLGFSIYNPDKKIITEFTKNELQFYANIMFITTSIRYIFEIMVTVAQIDIALYSVIVSEITTIFTIRLLLNEKIFNKNEIETETPHLLVNFD